MERVSSDIPGVTGRSTQGGQVTEQAREQGQQLAQQARQQAGELANRGSEQVKSQLANQKHQVAQRMTPIQTALRESGHQLRSQGQGPVADYADKAADQVERLAGYLRENDVDRLLNDARGFARRNPTLFLGSAAALGFLATRFLKSSSEGGASPDYGYRVTPTATSRATVSYGTREVAPAPQPGIEVPVAPASEQALNERTRPTMSPGEPTEPSRGS